MQGEEASGWLRGRPADSETVFWLAAEADWCQGDWRWTTAETRFRGNDTQPASIIGGRLMGVGIRHFRCHCCGL